MPEHRSIVGVLPAAGRARRLGRLPCSKEILPVGRTAASLVPAIACAIRGFRLAGIREAWLCIAPGKDDIRAFLGSEYDGVRLNYHVVESSGGAPESIASLGDRLTAREIALAFPDIQFTPADAIGTTLQARLAGQADICLGLVPSSRGDKVDLVDVDDSGRIRSLAMKPGPGRRGWTWIAAAWGPEFSRLLLDWEPKLAMARESYFGDVINGAISTGLSASGLLLPDGDALDIGTPDDFETAWTSPRWARTRDS